MNCPECKALIKQEHVGWSMDDEEYDYIEITIECGCGKEFFTRIHQEDFVLCD